jgi:hypothetical protein
MRSDGVYGATTVNFAGDDGVITGTVIDIDHTGHNPLGDVRTAKYDASFVVYLDNVTIFDVSFFRFGRVNPHRLVKVAIRSLDLAGDNLVEPGKIIELGVYPPSGLIGANE